MMFDNEERRKIILNSLEAVQARLRMLAEVKRRDTEFSKFSRDSGAFDVDQAAADGPQSWGDLFP